VLLAGIQSLKTILKMDSRQEHAGMTNCVSFQKSLFIISNLFFFFLIPKPQLGNVGFWLAKLGLSKQEKGFETLSQGGVLDVVLN